MRNIIAILFLTASLGPIYPFPLYRSGFEWLMYPVYEIWNEETEGEISFDTILFQKPGILFWNQVLTSWVGIKRYEMELCFIWNALFAAFLYTIFSIAIWWFYFLQHGKLQSVFLLGVARRSCPLDKVQSWFSYFFFAAAAFFSLSILFAWSLFKFYHAPALIVVVIWGPSGSFLIACQASPCVL